MRRVVSECATLLQGGVSLGKGVRLLSLRLALQSPRPREHTRPDAHRHRHRRRRRSLVVRGAHRFRFALERPRFGLRGLLGVASLRQALGGGHRLHITSALALGHFGLLSSVLTAHRAVTTEAPRRQSCSNWSPPCKFGKCREILTKCRERPDQSQQKSGEFQVFRWQSPYSKEQGGDHC
jgi:hypothetical protein